MSSRESGVGTDARGWHGASCEGDGPVLPVAPAIKGMSEARLALSKAKYQQGHDHGVLALLLARRCDIGVHVRKTLTTQPAVHHRGLWHGVSQSQEDGKPPTADRKQSDTHNQKGHFLNRNFHC